ncbi:MAG: hypothetical protein KA498_13505, partial [Neisseriaceae bacterium]|nr:hypothetical protein [Neisseriaceae bacterium]
MFGWVKKNYLAKALASNKVELVEIMDKKLLQSRQEIIKHLTSEKNTGVTTAQEPTQVNILTFKNIDLILKLIALLSIISTAWGALAIFHYLQDIGYQVLFSSALANSSSLITIAFTFTLLIILTYGISYVSPYVLMSHLNHKDTSNPQKHYKMIATLLIIQLILTIAFIFCYAHHRILQVYTNVFLYGIILFPSAIFLIYLVFLTKKEVIHDRITLFCFSFFTLFSSFATTIYSILLISGWFDLERNNAKESLFSITMAAVIIIGLAIFNWSVSYHKINEKKETQWWGFPAMSLFILGIILPTLPTSKINQNMMWTIGYIEQPTDARPYAVNSKNPDIYQNLQQNKQNKTPNSPEINTPTPYMIGYLAWNLGEYKVF